jgi:hypothetical protein
MLSNLQNDYFMSNTYRIFSLHQDHVEIAGYLGISPLSGNFSAYEDAKNFYDKSCDSWPSWNNHETQQFPNILIVEDNILYFTDGKTGNKASPLVASADDGSRIKIDEKEGKFFWEEINIEGKLKTHIYRIFVVGGEYKAGVKIEIKPLSGNFSNFREARDFYDEHYREWSKEYYSFSNEKYLLPEILMVENNILYNTDDRGKGFEALAPAIGSRKKVRIVEDGDTFSWDEVEA